MNRGATWLAGVIAYGALAAGAIALTMPGNLDTSSTPYSAIVDRNVFDLRAPKPVDTAPPAPVTPPPNVKLVGLMDTGQPKAVLSVTDPSAPSKPPVNIVLGIGQS